MDKFIVYMMCALTSLACFVLLVRSYFATRARLLLGSSVAFAFLALNNILLFVDIVLLPSAHLEVTRSLAALTGVLVLVCSLVWRDA